MELLEVKAASRALTSDEFSQVNQRKHDLVDKKYSAVGLSPSEEAELQLIQWRIGRHYEAEGHETIEHLKTIAEEISLLSRRVDELNSFAVVTVCESTGNTVISWILSPLT